MTPNFKSSSRLISILTKEEILNIRFSRSISKKIWNQRQKRMSLGLSNTTENRKIAEKIIVQIEQDIKANRLETNLNYYLPSNQLKREVGIAYNPNQIDISLIDLFLKYAKFKKPRLSEATYVDRYMKRYLGYLKKCPQDLNKQPELIKKLYEAINISDFIGLSGILASMLDWAKKNDIIPKNARNDIREIAKDYRTAIPKRKLSKLVQKIDDYVEDKDVKCYSIEEARVIIQRFEEYAYQKSVMRKNGAIYPISDFQRKSRLIALNYIKFCFWTGCRLSEASGIRWQDVDKDFNFVVFRNAFNMRTKKLKSLKTEKVGEEGTKPRKFPCGDKLKHLLLDLKSNNLVEPKKHLFTCLNGSIYHYQHLQLIWYGRRKKYDRDKTWNKGVVVKLVEEQKISQYLTPYSMRHTWINHQLINGVPIANVAKFAGNSPEIIFKNYISYRPDIPLASEI